MAMPIREPSSSRMPNPDEAEPVTILIAEHRVTEQALNCLERMAERWAERGGRCEQFDCQAVREIIVFFQVFVEAWHFRREEAYFGVIGVRLERVCIDEGGTCIFHDHEHSSMHLRSIEEAANLIASRSSASESGYTDRGPERSGASGCASRVPPVVADAYRKFGEHARAYSDILLRHIEDEEDFIYPTIERQATPENRQAAVEAFRKASRATVDGRKLDECLGMIDRLAERFGVAPRATRSTQTTSP